MPARVIRGEINSSRSLSRVSLQADLTFRALLVAVDDYGRLDADPLMLKAALFPRRTDVSDEHIEAWLSELEAEECIRRYVVKGCRFLFLVNWEQYRGRTNRAKESRFPKPPESSRRFPEIPGDSGNLPPRSSSSSSSSLSISTSGPEAAPACESAGPPEQEPEPAAPAGGRGAWTPAPEVRAKIDFSALRAAAKGGK